MMPPYPPVVAIVRPMSTWTCWQSFNGAVRAASAAVALLCEELAQIPSKPAAETNNHLGERQRVNLYRSRGGGKRRKLTGS